MRTYRSDLVEGLLCKDLIRETFTVQAGGMAVFKLDEFIDSLRYKRHVGNSYTEYANKIGLTDGNRFLDYNSDIVINFPYKDSVLEGGMTTEDARNNNETYYHEVLGKEEVDLLLSPKVHANPIRITKGKRIDFTSGRKGAPQLKRYLSEVKQWVTPMPKCFPANQSKQRRQ